MTKKMDGNFRKTKQYHRQMERARQHRIEEIMGNERKKMRDNDAKWRWTRETSR